MERVTSTTTKIKTAQRIWQRCSILCTSLG
uniref:Uncharacterized protein n=1 Tax=Anguilla anguilla TaxID=7936 RepID=A0A0E9UKL7_ANGAN